MAIQIQSVHPEKQSLQAPHRAMSFYQISHNVGLLANPPARNSESAVLFTSIEVAYLCISIDLAVWRNMSSSFFYLHCYNPYMDWILQAVTVHPELCH